MNFKAQLTELAREIGFDSCRVTACAPPAHIPEFEAWLGDGAAGEMGYMTRGAEKRADPQEILPGARSIIVLAMNYFQGPVQAGVSPANGRIAADTAAATDHRATGRIARYAWGDDYHEVLELKLQKIDELLLKFG